MDEQYTDLAELAQALSIRKQNVAKRAKREKWTFEEIPHPGHPKRIYRLDGLPEMVSLAVVLLRARQRPAPVSPYYESKSIPEFALEKGLARLELHTAWQKHRSKAKSKENADAEFLVAYNTGQSHPRLLEALGKVGRSTLYRWDRCLKQADGDFRILCDHRGWAPAEGKPGNIGAEAERAFLGIYLSPQRPSAVLAYRAMCAVLAEQRIPIPSLRSTYRFINRYTTEHEDHVTLMREGEKALADRIGPFIDRDDSILEVGDVLVADGHRLNFDCIHPFTGKPARMTLILWIDWASRMPLGWEIMPEENTIAIASALRMAITRLGKTPKVAYIDNGRAFRAKYFTRTSVEQFQMETRGVFARLGIQPQYARPYQGRSKIIERFFGTFDTQCARLLPTHRGSSVADKPAYLMRNEKFHRARQPKGFPAVQDALEIFADYVGWFSQQPHKGLDGGLPIETFLAGQGEGVDASLLDFNFMWRKEVHPRRCRIRLAGIDFESDALYGLDQPILVYYAWNDFSRIQMYVKRTGEYLGVARPVRAVHPMARHLGSDMDLIQVQEALKRQARLKKQTMELAKEHAAAGSGLNILDYVGVRDRVLLETTEPPPQEPEPVELTEAERREIEQARRDYEARKAAAPPYERPDFNKPLDRYDHLYELKHFQGVDLLPEDQAFMAEYEASDEYQFVYRRYEQMQRHLSALKAKKKEAAK